MYRALERALLIHWAFNLRWLNHARSSGSTVMEEAFYVSMVWRTYEVKQSFRRDAVARRDDEELSRSARRADSGLNHEPSYCRICD